MCLEAQQLVKTVNRLDKHAELQTEVLKWHSGGYKITQQDTLQSGLERKLIIDNSIHSLTEVYVTSFRMFVCHSMKLIY